MFLIQRVQKEVAASDDCLQVFPCLSRSLLELITLVIAHGLNQGESSHNYSNGCNYIRY